MSKNNDSGRVPAEERTPAEEPDKANLVGSILSVAGYGRLLEIGCTTGGIAEPLIRNGLDVWGLAIDNCCDAKGMTTIPGQLVSGSITRIPYADHSFGTVIAINCLCDLPDNDVPAVLHEIHRVCSRTFLVRLSISNLAVETGNSTSRSKSWWETALLEAGFRKHPAYYRLNTYESSGQEQGNVVLAYEKISPTLLARYPFHSLRTERDLHMDMLREHGSRSDAHVARYQLACKFVRPGDSVVDAASGLGYGSHVIQSQTKCASILGIDSSQNGIRYATDNFSREGRVRFVKGELPACLGQLPSGSVDCIISFETLEHIDQPQALLSEFHRLLSPGGRLIASVPHDWSDETGADPNPHHLHVYDRAKFTSQLGEHFEIEHLYAQTADRVKLPGGSCEWVARPRSLTSLDCVPDTAPLEAEWLLAVACKSPIGEENVPYVEKVFSTEEVNVAGNSLAFARDYLNPWLVRSMVAIGLRTENRNLRRKWALETVRISPLESADHGAALCTLAYIDLEDATCSQPALLNPEIDRYVSIQHTTNPNILRWQVSLAFVGGLTSLALGQHEKAKRYFMRVLEFPVSSYSPTLLTKPAEAAYWLGLLHLADGHHEIAKEIWQACLLNLLQDMARHLAKRYKGLPPSFELREISLALSFMGRLNAAALCATHSVERPGIFFDEVTSDFPARQLWLESQVAGWKQASAARDRSIEKLQEQAQVLLEGNAWLASQRDAWLQVATDRERLIESMQAQNQEATLGNAWLASQRDAWEQLASGRNNNAADLALALSPLQAQMQSVIADNAWLTSQRDAWMLLASQREQQIAALQAQVGNMTAGNAWHAAQRDAWVRVTAERERSIAILQSDLKKVTAGNMWLASQRDAWRQVTARQIEENLAQQFHLQVVIGGSAWHASERDVWMQIAAERERAINTLQNQVQEVSTANSWHASQRDAWKQIVVQQEKTIASLQAHVRDLQAGNTWHASQRDAWAHVVEDQEELIAALTAMHQKTSRTLAAREASLGRIHNHWGMRLVNFLSFKKVFSDREQQ